MRRRWTTWLVVCLGLLAVGQGGYWLLRAQGSVMTGVVVGVTGHVGVYLWVLWGLICVKQYPMARKGLTILLTGTGVVGLCFALGAAGREDVAGAVFGVWAMVVAFVLGLELIRKLLSPGWAVTSCPLSVKAICCASVIPSCSFRPPKSLSGGRCQHTDRNWRTWRRRSHAVSWALPQ